MVDLATLGWPAPHNGQITFADALRGEITADTPRCPGIQREQQHPRSAFVEAMHGMHATTQLVTQLLHRIACFVAIQVAAMHQQTSRFVDGDEALVTVNNLQHACVTRQASAVMNVCGDG